LRHVRRLTAQRSAWSEYDQLGHWPLGRSATPPAMASL
jgi:hypothetical protein